MTQDKCSLIDPHTEGNKIKVHFDLRGREWNEKYFTNLNAWKIEAAQSVAAATPPPTAAMSDFSGINENYADTSESSNQNTAEDFDDLPF